MTETKVLPDLPNDMSAPDILRALAAWLDEHPDVQPDSIDLTTHSNAERDRDGQDYMDVFVERYGASVSTGGTSRWADLHPPRGNDGRRIKVEVTVFGSRSAHEAELERLRAENAALRAAAPVGFGYSRELDEADDPTPVSPARGGPVHTGAVVDGGVLVDETRRVVSVRAAHGQAIAEDHNRMMRRIEKSMTSRDFGRIANPHLARELAESEDRRRTARRFLGLEESAKHYPPADDETPANALHFLTSGDHFDLTVCGLSAPLLSPGEGLTPDRDGVTCGACSAALAAEAR